MILLIELTFFGGIKRFGYVQTSLTVNDLTSVNSLPADLRLLNISLPVFRKRLKMFLF